MDTLQNQYEFSIHESVQKWRTLTANDGILLEDEFKVCFVMLFGELMSIGGKNMIFFCQ